MDQLELPGVDVVADANRPFDELPDNSVTEIYSSHTLEHVPELIPLMREFHRIVSRNGRIHIVVPHFSNPYFYSDPTHVRFFGLYSMCYFVSETEQPGIRKVPTFYTDLRFHLLDVWIGFYARSRLGVLTKRLLRKCVNCSWGTQDFYERHLCWSIPAWDVRYTLSPRKAE